MTVIVRCKVCNAEIPGAKLNRVTCDDPGCKREWHNLRSRLWNQSHPEYAQIHNARRKVARL